MFFSYGCWGCQFVLFMQIITFSTCKHKPNLQLKAKKTVCITSKLLLFSIFFFVWGCLTLADSCLYSAILTMWVKFLLLPPPTGSQPSYGFSAPTLVLNIVIFFFIKVQPAKHYGESTFNKVNKQIMSLSFYKTLALTKS